MKDKYAGCIDDKDRKVIDRMYNIKEGIEQRAQKAEAEVARLREALTDILDLWAENEMPACDRYNEIARTAPHPTGGTNGN